MVIGEHGRPDSLSAVLFDLDDTLLDSFDARVRALQSVFMRASILSPTSEQFLRSLQGTQLKEALTQFGETQKIEANLFEDYRKAYWTKELGMITLYPGVKPMLEELHRHGVRLGVVTQKPRMLEVNGCFVGASKELEELGIANLFSVIVGFEDVSHKKPDPEGINLALSRLATQPRETLVVGDSAADIEAARAAGCWSCYATWGLPVAEQRLDSIQAHLVTETPKTLLELKLWKTGNHQAIP